MTVIEQLQRARRSAQWAVAVRHAAIAAPLLIGVGALAARMGNPAWAVGVVLAGVACAAVLCWWRIRSFNVAWLARGLDAGRADMDDSAALLFASPAMLSSLQQLQRARLEARLSAQPWAPSRQAWPITTLVAAWSIGAVVVALALWWPALTRDAPVATSAPPRSGAAGAPVLQAQTLRIEAPAYTRQAPRTQAEFDAQAPVGSTMTWSLRFAPQPRTVALQLHDGREVAFAREGETWRATLRLDQSWLYRIAIDGDTDGGLARAQPWRLDAVPDRPPEVRVRAPEATLTTYAQGQRAWPLVFEATDDHGVAADARLRITVTHGSGEAITFEDHTRTLRGAGEQRARTFRVTLDPVALGIEEGGDLVAQLEVRDNRAPAPQTARSANLILRWPPPVPPDADGLEGLARDVLPAYFRSQRQIIIDAEALIAEQPRIERSVFEGRSDALGVDQRILRLRYGQFLGEEAEGGPRSPPTDDAEAPPRKPLPIDDFGQEDPASSTQAHPSHAHDHQHDHAHGDDAGHGTSGAHAHGHGHDHDHDHAPRDAMTFGHADDVLATYGHVHDLPEAATLLDPQTRETLRAALREMWQSELHLRQAAPREALGPANRALELIKQVQQADRIYLARVGSVLPPVDFDRRLGGDRDGIAPRAIPAPAQEDMEASARAWQALAWNDAFDPVALVEWVQRDPHAVDDPLALLAAIDALQRDPACVACRQALRGQLWSVLQRRLPTPARRAAFDAQGVRYLDALDGDTP